MIASMLSSSVGFLAGGAMPAGQQHVTAPAVNMVAVRRTAPFPAARGSACTQLLAMPRLRLLCLDLCSGLVCGDA